MVTWSVLRCNGLHGIWFPFPSTMKNVAQQCTPKALDSESEEASRYSMGLLPDAWNCGLRMCWEYWKRFPRGLAIPTCITARVWHTCHDVCRWRVFQTIFKMKVVYSDTLNRIYIISVVSILSSLLASLVQLRICKSLNSLQCMSSRAQRWRILMEEGMESVTS